MTYEEVKSILDDYLELETTAWTKPTWFECLSFLSGYCGCVSMGMILLVRKYQREGLVE